MRKIVDEMDIEEFLERMGGILEVDRSMTSERSMNFYPSNSKCYIIKGASLAFYITANRLHWIEIDEEGNLWSCDLDEAIEIFSRQLTDEQMNKILFNLDFFNKS